MPFYGLAVKTGSRPIALQKLFFFTLDFFLQHPSQKSNET